MLLVSSCSCLCQIHWNQDEDEVGAVPTGDAPTTSEWLTILLPTKVLLVLEGTLQHKPPGAYFTDVV